MKIKSEISFCGIFCLILSYVLCWGSSVSIETKLWAGQLGNLGSIPGRVKRFSSSKCPDWLWVSSNLLFNGYQGSFVLEEWPGHETDHLLILLNLRMSGGIPLLSLGAS
jgi:hypothetical protein